MMGLLPSNVWTSHYLQNIDNPHGIGHIAIRVILVESVRHIDHGPRHNPRPSVEEQLEIEPLPDTWVELDTHHEIVEDIAGEFAVGFAGREVVGFDEDEYGNQVAEEVSCPQHLTPVVKHQDGGPPFELQTVKKKQTCEGREDEGLTNWKFNVIDLIFLFITDDHWS